jgi:hypothetical protein
MALTDNMKLNLPVPSATPGPTYASEIVTAFEAVDEHDHTTDKGVKVPSAGLNVNDDIPCNDHNLTDARTVRFHNQVAALALSTDLGCLYEAGGDLYWNSGAGDIVRLTSGPALDAASIGAIGGDYGTSSASLFYTTASKTFTFESDTLKPAAIDAGPLTIREIATSAKGITIESPATLAADYGLTLPAGLPASTKFLTLSAAGLIAAGPDVPIVIDTTNLADGAVTQAKRAALGQQVSASCGGFSTTSGSYVDVTNLSVTITTTGRPVLVKIQNDSANYGAITARSASPSYLADVWIRILRDSVVISEQYIGVSINPAHAQDYIHAAADFTHVDVVVAGTYVYKVQIRKASSDYVALTNAKLMAFEL